jgi:hypothetical protein
MEGFIPSSTKHFSMLSYHWKYLDVIIILFRLQYNSEDVTLVLKNNTIHKGSARWCTFNPSGSCKEIFNF